MGFLNAMQSLAHVVLSDTGSDEEQTDSGHMQDAKCVDLLVKPVKSATISVQTSDVEIDTEPEKNVNNQQNSNSIDRLVSSLAVDTNGDETASESLVETRLSLESRYVQQETTENSCSADVEAVDYVWYGCYGSNMLKERFLCYLQGGQVYEIPFSVSGTTLQCHLFLFLTLLRTMMY